MISEPQRSREPLLAVRDLTVQHYSSQSQSTPATAVAGVSFSLAAGESIGIFGRSGSGKTTLARSLVGLGTRNCKVTSGSIRFRGTELVGLPFSKFQALRGRDIALVGQEPELALNPVLPVGQQIVEVLRAHVSVSARAYREQARWMLAKVRLDDSGIYRSYPHQLSGGQKQRVVIAQCLICKPALLIADEPTSALDPRNQAEIVALLQALRDEFNLALILISHNMQLLRGVTNRLACMSDGRLTENAIPDTFRFTSSVTPNLTQPHDGTAQPVIEACGLIKHYRRGTYWSSHRHRVTALAGVDIALQRGQTIALVGESGSGKTTLARCLALLERPDAGEIRFQGRTVSGLSRKQLAGTHGRIQLVFQHSALALNPQLSAGEIVSEPLQIQEVGSNQQRREAALNWMERVGLSSQWAARRAPQFSGGQRQRLAIARAMILNPDVVIFDEALAGLDPATCAGVLHLLLKLQSSSATSYIFITHDLQMATELTKSIVMMRDGKITDSGMLRGRSVPSAYMRQTHCTPHT